MLFSRHLTLTQALLVTYEQVFKKSSDPIFVDKPLSSQEKVTPVDMIKFSLQLDVNLNATLKAGVLKKDMSIDEMAGVIDKQLDNFSAACELKIA
tara:strand:- start:2102 stop:2386 length:285 start_codon:yes stop_codon:yes gene_type:complete